MGSSVLAFLVLFSGSVLAQAAPSLSCAVSYKGKSEPMFWFAQNQSHHSGSSLDTLAVTIQEKEESGKVELTIMEAVDDEAYDKFSEIVEAAGLEASLKKRIRELGRTRVTHAFVALYAGVLHYEHRLGTDPNLYEISCARL